MFTHVHVKADRRAMATSPARRAPRGIRRDLQAVGQLKGDSMESELIARAGQADETDRLISSEKVDGTAVYNRQSQSPRILLRARAKASRFRA
jgi:hypothetical protein